MGYRTITGDALSADLCKASIQTIITSPPYFGEKAS